MGLGGGHATGIVHIEANRSKYVPLALSKFSLHAGSKPIQVRAVRNVRTQTSMYTAFVLSVCKRTAYMQYLGPAAFNCAVQRRPAVARALTSATADDAHDVECGQEFGVESLGHAVKEDGFHSIVGAGLPAFGLRRVHL